MIKRKFTLLLLILFLLNLTFYVNFNIATTQNYIPRKIDIDRSEIPKNILVGSFVGGRSHLKPILDVATILIERGYNVMLLTAGRYEPASEYPGLKQFSLGPQMHVKNMNVDIHKEFDYRGLEQVMGLTINAYNETYKKYERIAKDYNVDLFFCDVLMNEACLDIGHNLKKPVVGMMSLLQMMDPKPYKSDPLFGCNISLENESFLERFRCAVIQPLQIVSSIGKHVNKLNDVRDNMNVKTRSGKVPKVDLALIDTFFGFELPQSLAPNVQEIGPVLSAEHPPLTPELSDFMNAHKRVLYVAFGTRFFTTTENNNKILQSIVEAINKKLFDGVVWPLVETSKDDFHSTLNLSDGTQIQTSPILNNKHPHIRIVKFAPQFAMLNHTNTKLFFTHGGAGSVHECLYIGKPMLVLPLGGDQMGNSQRLKSAGVALSLTKFTLNVNDILNKMDFLLKDENVKKNVNRLQLLAKINSKRKYRAADLIEYVLHRSGISDNHVDDDFLKEWSPAEERMGFIKANNLDIYATLLGIILVFIWGVLYNLIRFIVNPLSVSIKSKKA